MEKLFLNKNTEAFLKSQLNPETRLAQSLLFCGEENLGKLYTAKLFAKSILCENHTWLGCNNCNSCKAFDNGWHSDFKIFTHETHKEGEKEIDQYREVQLFLGYKPQVSSNRILIIDQFEQMTRDAQSTSLKLLEEPFPNSIIIVISSFASKLPETILSRLLPIRFTKEPEENLKNFLKDNYKIKEDDLDFYLALGENKIGKTIHLIKDPEYLKEKIDNIKLLINIIDNNFVNASSIISKITTKTKKKVNDEKEENNKDDETEEKENKENKELNQMVKDWLGFLHQILIHNDISLWEKHLKVNLSFLNENPHLLRKLLRNSLQLQNYTANYNLNKKLMLETFYLTVK